MTTREWSFKINTPHTVKVEHSRFTGEVFVFVDGKVVFRRHRKFLDTGLEHRFEIEEKPCLLRILFRTWLYEYELWVDGKLQQQKFRLTRAYATLLCAESG